MSLITNQINTVLCHSCGTPLDGTKGLSICHDCIKLTCDITQGIPREANVNFCRNCERYLQPPSQWIVAQPESRELLALLLRKLRGLHKVRLTDAKFIWTEPHSRRLKVNLTVQGEAMIQTIIQQSFEVEYVVIASQCPDCAKSFTANTWRAALQIRQKVPHKRTFLYLEQCILKHNAHLETISVKEARDGLDFYYSQKNHAIKMLDFLTNVVPLRCKTSQELISQDTHTGDKSYKFTFSVELAPICRDDLVVLPRKLANQLGCINQVVLCSRVTSSLHFLDPGTLQTAELSGSLFWRSPFKSLANQKDLIEFCVLDVEPLGLVKNKWALADVHVACASDMTKEFFVRSQLGGILHPGDSVLGYHTVESNYNNVLWDQIAAHEVPDVVLVRKIYPQRSRKRNWKLKRMAKEHNIRDDNIDKVEEDYELFLQELEEDQELRGSVNLYRKKQASENQMEEDTDQADGPVISVDELLEDLDDLALD